MAIDCRDRVIGRDDLDAFPESLLDMVVFEMVESREGGGTSGKVVVEGDCSLEDGTDTTTGDDTAVPTGLLVVTGELRAPTEGLLVASYVCSLTPPTDARMRLYRPLRPPCTSSMPFGSPVPGGAGGAVRSPKVVRESERDAVVCIWWSASGSAPRESRAMAMVWGSSEGACSGSQQAERGRRTTDGF